jgi:low temperature requirement protein LtrA
MDPPETPETPEPPEPPESPETPERRGGSPRRGPAERVSTLELFFDLVFVFTITQLTTVLTDDPTPRGLLRSVLLLGVIWWMYGGYAWLTNAVPPDQPPHRLLLLASMAGFLVVALAVPRAFGDGGVAFGLAYLVVVCVHVALYTRTYSVSAAQAILRFAPFNLASALLVLGAGVAGALSGASPWTYALWIGAVALEWVTPLLAGLGGFEVGPAHFVERHGLVVLIAIGESVVAIGIGAGGRPVDGPLAGVAVLGLLLCAGLWWAYFGGDDARAEQALAAAPPDRRPRLALDAFGYWHLPILLGIVATSAGLEQAVGHPFEPLGAPVALALAGGVALFLLGDVFFRRALGITGGPWRGIAAALALATIPLGVAGTAVGQLAALVVLLALTFAAERAGIPAPSARPGRGSAPAPGSRTRWRGSP